MAIYPIWHGKYTERKKDRMNEWVKAHVKEKIKEMKVKKVDWINEKKGKGTLYPHVDWKFGDITWLESAGACTE